MRRYRPGRLSPTPSRRPRSPRADLDVEVTLDLLFAPVYYRLMLGRETLDEPFAAASARLLIAGLSNH
jgi:hypothetical protein